MSRPILIILMIGFIQAGFDLPSIYDFALAAVCGVLLILTKEQPDEH